MLFKLLEDAKSSIISLRSKFNLLNLLVFINNSLPDFPIASWITNNLFFIGLDSSISLLFPNLYAKSLFSLLPPVIAPLASNNSPVKVTALEFCLDNLN